ncbi:MAG: DUF5677 domain-containing protein [Desulfomonilia bacterium]|jgi:hypothetical protein
MEILVFVKRLHEECINHTNHITFDKTHPRHLHLVGLYGTLIEFTGCILKLIESKLRTGIAPIFRSFFEAYIELRNLHENANYGYHMDASYHEQWLKLLNEAKNTPNPFLKDFSEFEGLDAQIAVHETALKELIDKGYKPLNIFQRFKRAGMIDEYRSIYNFLSNDTHSNIGALVDRHLEVSGDDFKVVYYKDEPITSFLPTLDSIAGFLIDASFRIHNFFETTISIDHFEDLSRTLTKIRENYS